MLEDVVLFSTKREKITDFQHCKWGKGQLVCALTFPSVRLRLQSIMSSNILKLVLDGGKKCRLSVNM